VRYNPFPTKRVACGHSAADTFLLLFDLARRKSNQPAKRPSQNRTSLSSSGHFLLPESQKNELMHICVCAPRLLGIKRDDVVVNSAIVCFLNSLRKRVTRVACQVSSLHPSNDYKTVRMYARSMGRATAVLSLVSFFFFVFSFG